MGKGGGEKGGGPTSSANRVCGLGLWLGVL